VLGQLLLGGAVSFLNFGIHAAMTGVIVVATRHTANATDELHVFIRIVALLTITVTALTFAHLAEIGVWAWFYGLVGVYDTPAVSVFDAAFENYTAPGYGDAVPVHGMRLYGPIAALNGLLLIGWSVAIIFEVLRMAEVQVGRHKPAVRPRRR
jgi:hypothetical protein